MSKIVKISICALMLVSSSVFVAHANFSQSTIFLKREIPAKTIQKPKTRTTTTPVVAPAVSTKAPAPIQKSAPVVVSVPTPLAPISSVPQAPIVINPTPPITAPSIDVPPAKSEVIVPVPLYPTIPTPVVHIAEPAPVVVAVPVTPLVVAPPTTPVAPLTNVQTQSHSDPAQPLAPQTKAQVEVAIPNSINGEREEYKGVVYHVFFHSLIIYPQKALADTGSLQGYKDYMITVAQGKKVIQQLYDNNFVLIDPRILYALNPDGTMRPQKLYIPKGKKPLILSIDDLSYYAYMKNGGFANKLVVEDGIVKTQVLPPSGGVITTTDGDVVPIVDAFVAQHPDFSLDGAKGVIGLTGYEGVFGYRTHWKGEQGDGERQQAKIVADALRNTGWLFASHSFSHGQPFLKNTATQDFLAKDIALWESQVAPIVGSTNMFIGPFGQVFGPGDPRRAQLVDAGFNVLFGVGMDRYTKFFGTHMVMTRIDIDGYRLRNNAKKLYDWFGILVDPNF